MKTIPCQEYEDAGMIPVDYNDCPRYIKNGGKYHCIGGDGEDKCQGYVSDQLCTHCGCLTVSCKE